MLVTIPNCYSLANSGPLMLFSGPNEVTMFNPEAFLKVYGPESRCTKSIFYDAPRPFTSVVNQRDTQTHARWRKVWDQAFNQKGRIY